MENKRENVDHTLRMTCSKEKKRVHQLKNDLINLQFNYKLYFTALSHKTRQNKKERMKEISDKSERM